MTQSPRSIYLDLDPLRRTKPRIGHPPTLRLMPAVHVAPGPPPVRVPVAVASVARETSDHDCDLLAALDMPGAFGESAAALHHRKEQALGAVFAALSVAEARALHKRLTSPTADDVVCARFGRLIADRRDRLLAFLESAQRREAIANARRPSTMRSAGSEP